MNAYCIRSLEISRSLIRLLRTVWRMESSTKFLRGLLVARVLNGLAECHLGGGNDSVASIRQGLADWQKHTRFIYLN